MKKTVKNLVMITAIAVAGSAGADCCWWEDLCMCPYIGVDFKETWMKAKSDWNQVLSDAYPGATLYIGSKFGDCWGLELGYTGSGRKNRDNVISNRGFFGFPNTSTGSETVHTSVRLQSYHIDLNGYYPLDDCGCWDLIGSVGVASMKAKITTNAVNGPFTAAHRDGFNSIHGENRGIARIGVGTQYIFCDMVGARAIVRWENTSNLRIEGNSNFDNTMSNISRKPFRDAVSLALGLFLQF